MREDSKILPLEDWGLFPSISRPLVIAGPCSAETKEQVMETAERLFASGIRMFRAGIWKPRTHPHSFEGVGKSGLEWMKEVREVFGMKIMTEVANPLHLREALKAGMDAVWIGARTTTNPFAVQEIADALRGVDIPVFIKNPVNPDIELWIGAFERFLDSGINKLAAIHRGFSVAEAYPYRNSPHWQIPLELKRRLKNVCIFGDPSHMGGDTRYVGRLCQEFMDLGYRGLIVESHSNPANALSDAFQQVLPDTLSKIIESLKIRETDSNILDCEESIERMRSHIDEIDGKIVELIADRLYFADEIGRCKKTNNMTIFQFDRWDGILKRISELAGNKHIDKHIVTEIFRLIHQASIDRQNFIFNESEIFGTESERESQSDT